MKEKPGRRPSERFTGALLGLACGDALGAPVEFQSREAVNRAHGTLRAMVGGGQFGWQPGEWTDDTGMALCVAEGILEAPADPVPSIGERFLEWKKTTKDIGGIISAALSGYEGSWTTASRSTPQAKNGRAAGNGSLMRTLPVALAYPDRLEMLLQSARISAMTHWDPQAEVCCAVYCLWVRAILRGDDLASGWAAAIREARLLTEEAATFPDTPGLSPLPDELWSRLEAAPQLGPGELQPTGYAGYVVECLEAAVNRAIARQSVEASLVALVNLGGETDTMAAVAGGVAGARHGIGAIPDRWLEALLGRDRIERTARELAGLRHRLTYARPGLPGFSFSTLEPGLVVGRNPLTTEDVETLLDQEVTAILDLREEDEWSSAGVYGREAVAALDWCGIERLHLPISDGAPPGKYDLDRADAFLDRLRATEGSTIFVHCRAGIERTGAVVVAHLARKNGLDFDRALERAGGTPWRLAPLPVQRSAVEAWLEQRGSAA